MNKERLTNLIRETGEKATKARIDVLSALSHERYPLSIKEIAKKVKAPDQSTLYRTLSGFARNGLVREVILDKDEVRYEIAVGRKHHHHIVCTSCGEIEDIHPCKNEEEKVKKTSRKFADITGHALEFFGICKNCAEA